MTQKFNLVGQLFGRVLKTQTRWRQHGGHAHFIAKNRFFLKSIKIVILYNQSIDNRTLSFGSRCVYQGACIIVHRAFRRVLFHIWNNYVRAYWKNTRTLNMWRFGVVPILISASKLIIIYYVANYLQQTYTHLGYVTYWNCANFDQCQ